MLCFIITIVYHEILTYSLFCKIEERKNILHFVMCLTERVHTLLSLSCGLFGWLRGRIYDTSFCKENKVGMLLFSVSRNHH